MTWLGLGRQEEALIAADPAANSVCSAADLNLAWRGPERSPACRGEVTGTGRKAVKMELLRDVESTHTMKRSSRLS